MSWEISDQIIFPQDKWRPGKIKDYKNVLSILADAKENSAW